MSAVWLAAAIFVLAAAGMVYGWLHPRGIHAHATTWDHLRGWAGRVAAWGMRRDDGDWLVDDNDEDIADIFADVPECLCINGNDPGCVVTAVVNCPRCGDVPDKVLDPDCAAGKHQSCVGGPCDCICHMEWSDRGYVPRQDVPWPGAGDREAGIAGVTSVPAAGLGHFQRWEAPPPGATVLIPVQGTYLPLDYEPQPDDTAIDLTPYPRAGRPAWHTEWVPVRPNPRIPCQDYKPLRPWIQEALKAASVEEAVADIALMAEVRVLAAGPRVKALAAAP